MLPNSEAFREEIPMWTFRICSIFFFFRFGAGWEEASEQVGEGLVCIENRRRGVWIQGGGGGVSTAAPRMSARVRGGGLNMFLGPKFPLRIL